MKLMPKLKARLPSTLASQSALIFLARVFGAGLMFIGQAAIARVWGAAVLGEYIVVIAAANLIAAFMPLGFQTIGTYFAAEYRAKGQGRLIWRFSILAFAQLAVVAVLVVMFGLDGLSLFGATGAVVAVHFPAMVAIAISTALMFLDSSLLIGLKRPFAGFIADTLLRPGLMVAGFLVALFILKGGIGELLNVFAIGYGILGILHFLFTIWCLRDVQVDGEDVPLGKEAGRWWRFALPWVLIALATDFFFDLDLVALSSLMSPDELAIFGVCARIFSLASFGVLAVYSVTMPDVFEAEAMNDRAGFMSRIGDANVLAAGASILLFGLAGIFGPFVLLLFGTSFLAGSAPLAVLCLALAVRSAFGPTSLVLSIHDHPYASLPAVAAGLVTLVGANMALVPPFGLIGASVSALIAITVWSAMLWFVAWRMTGIDVSIMPRIRKRQDSKRAKLAAE